jgi:rubrerythrin
MMKKPTDIGANRTGIATSPIDSQRLTAAAKEAAPSSPGDATLISAVRVEYERDSEPVGTLPPPVTVKGVVKTVVGAVKGENANVLIDKLGERLAFELGGTRLYEALIAKLAAAQPHAGGPTREALEEIRDEELKHAGILMRAIERIGADPTALTPCADVTGVIAEGLVQVLTDPRTTLTQCLNAILTAELTDNASWELLAELAAGLEQDELAEECRLALAEEEVHLARVRGWLSSAVLGQAGIAEEAEEAAEPTTPAV